MLKEAAQPTVQTGTRRLGLTIALLAAAFIALFGRAGDARAGLAWCATDPIISVNGQEISVWINVPADRVADVEEAVIVFHVPRNADVDVVYVDQSLFPERVVIKKDLPYWKEGWGPLVVWGSLSIEAEGRPFRAAVEVIDAVGAEWYSGASYRDISFRARASR